MADFYDMNAAIRPQNYFASFVKGQEVGQRAREFKQEQDDRNAWRDLAPQVLAGDPNAVAKAAVIDQKATMGLQDTEAGLLRRAKAMSDQFQRARQSGNPEAPKQFYRMFSPFMSQLTGRPAPEGDYDEATMGPAFEQFVAGLDARLAGIPAEQGEQFTLAPGSKRFDSSGKLIAESGFAPANSQYVDVPDGHGGSRKMVFDPRTGQLVEPEYGSQAYAPPSGIQLGVNGPYTLGADLTPDQVAAVQAAEAGGGDNIQLPPRDVSPQQYRSGGLGYTPPKPREADAESFSQPVTVINPETGRRELVQFGNRGGRRVVEGYAPEPPKNEGAGEAKDGLNDRQRVAVQGVQRNLVQYASALTEIPVEQLQRMSAQEIARAVQEKGGRFVQGGVARVMGNFPGGQTAAQVQNSDILSYSQGAGAAWAGYENPTGIITNADREAATAQMPNYLDPPEVQAAKIRSFLELSGWDDRNGRQAPSAQEGAPGGWGIREIK